MTIRHPDFQLVDRNSGLYQLAFRVSTATPVLDSYIAKGDPKSGKPFENRDMVPNRVGFIKVEGGVIDCMPMTWAQHVWTNPDEVRNALPADEQLHVISMSVLIETGDGMFPLSLRSKNVTLYPEHWHMSAAGYVDLSKARPSCSLLHTVFAEIEEEINLLASDITFVQQLGLCKHTRSDSAVIESCFYAKTNLGSDDVLSRVQNAKDTYEGNIHMFSGTRVREMLETEPFVPSALATALLTFDR
ncbi:MAG: hypothetical protein Q7S26_03230 [bacterium]|nr:hypothetical protein [bacterium]